MHVNTEIKGVMICASVNRRWGLRDLVLMEVMPRCADDWYVLIIPNVTVSTKDSDDSITTAVTNVDVE